MMMKSHKQIRAAVLYFFTAFGACAAFGQVAMHAPSVPSVQAANVQLEKPVARVNGTALTARDLMREMMNEFPYARQHGGRFPTEFEAQIRRSALRQIEFDELLYQEAQRRKMTVAPAKLQQAMADFKKH